MSEQAEVQGRVQQWIQQCVIGLSLCPFAKVPYQADRVRLSICAKTQAREILTELAVELVNLTRQSDQELETTLLVLPDAPMRWPIFWTSMISSDLPSHCSKTSIIISSFNWQPFILAISLQMFPLMMWATTPTRRHTR